MYLNTSTNNIYCCTTAGNASTAKWTYVGNIKGATGAKGNTGATGATGANNAVTQTITTANASYRILMSYTADNTTRTEGARKAANLSYNPGALNGGLTTDRLNISNASLLEKQETNGTTVIQSGNLLAISTASANNNQVNKLPVTYNSNMELNFTETPIELGKILAPNGSATGTVGGGTSGYCLKTNGSQVYWASDNNTSRKIYIHHITIMSSNKTS